MGNLFSNVHGPDLVMMLVVTLGTIVMALMSVRSNNSIAEKEEADEMEEGLKPGAAAPSQAELAARYRQVWGGNQPQ